MTKNQAEKLLQQANQAAEQQDWQTSMDYLNKAYQLDPTNAGLLSGIGTCLLNLGRAADAVFYFEKSVEHAGDSPEAYNNLGVAYLISGNLEKAELAFKEALWLDDDDARSWKNLAQVYLGQKERLADGLQILAAVVKSNPEDTEALFQLALCYEIGGDLTSTREVLERVLQIDPDHAQAKQVLQDISQSTSRDEQLRKLSNLKSLLQKEPPLADLAPGFRPVKNVPPIKPARVMSAVLYPPDDFSAFERVPALKMHYAKTNYQVDVEKSFSTEHINKYDLLIFCNPILAAWMVDAAHQCIQKEKPFAVDLDVDFHQIQPDHPAYSQVGPGNQRAIQVLNIMLNEAKVVTVATKVMKERYQNFAKTIELAPPAWDSSLPGWNRPGPRHGQLHIGWMGSIADLPDLKAIKTPLLRFFKEYPESVWVAAGCDEAYDIFDELPEDRRLFLPPPTPDSVAYLLSNFDIMLLPLSNNAYNQAKSEIPILFAGIRRIPWIASNIQSIQEWGSGGLIAKTKEDWYKHLKSLAESKEMRTELGETGRKLAEERKLQ